MFARYFVELQLPFERVRDAVTRSPEEWLPGIARRADDASQVLLTEVGFGARERIDRTAADKPHMTAPSFATLQRPPSLGGPPAILRYEATGERKGQL